MLEEKLITQWLAVSRILKNKRVVERIPYNEAMIMSALYSVYPDYLDFKEIVAQTKLLKSQVNRTMNALIEKQWVDRRIKASDKRCQEIRLLPCGYKVIEVTHQDSLRLSKKMISIIGTENVEKLIDIFQLVIDNYDENNKNE